MAGSCQRRPRPWRSDSAVRRSKETREGGRARSFSWEPNSLAFQKLLVLSTAVLLFGCIGPRVWAIGIGF
ncbi:hypothetical protein ERO13_A12G106650v2 [Gossypium hirsutum]|nr:hypothetical protein ERO13_A12G106650v2 [Gossypium hirsutum]